MKIRGLDRAEQGLIQQAAELLVVGFRANWPTAWPDLETALAEVQEALLPGKLLRAALDESGTLLGWVGGIPQYDGHVWEVHPLVVDPAQQRRGIGATLLRDLEAQVKLAGGLTLWLGTDDESGMTSLSEVDLYTDLWTHIRQIRNLRRHPYEFYCKQGFTICGVVPDANGPGKPDILMAKRVT